MSIEKSETSWPLQFAVPEEVGFCPERLSRIGLIMQGFIDKQKVPHLITLIARHGKIVHYEARGYMDIETKEPVKKDTIVRLWSNSKPIAGVATMICFEEGKLALEHPVSRYLPSYKNQVVKVFDAPVGQQRRTRDGDGSPMIMIPTVPVDKEMTIRDLLRNTSGLASAGRTPIQYLNQYRQEIEDAGLMAPLASRVEDMKKMVDALGKLPLDYHPGTVFQYHVGYPVLGVILEMVTGMSLEEFYQERIFKPLGMKDSSFYLPKEKIDRFPVCYRPVKEDGEWKLTVADRPETSTKVLGPKTFCCPGGGDGGVLSTIADYARFAQMLLNGGELDGVRILGRKTVELMTRSHTGDIPTIDGPGFGFGMGVGVRTPGGIERMRSIGAYGWGGAAGTTYFADPKEDLIAICFTQLLMAKMVPETNYEAEFDRAIYNSLV